jgi:hypothetical protein
LEGFNARNNPARNSHPAMLSGAMGVKNTKVLGPAAGYITNTL